MIRRALWPLVRRARIAKLHWLMRELPLHDLRQAELILELQQLEERLAYLPAPLSLAPPQRPACPRCSCPRLGEVA